MFGVHLFLSLWYLALNSNYCFENDGGGGLHFSFLSCFVFIKVVKAGELQSKKCPIEPIVLSIICNFNPNTSGFFSHYRGKKTVHHNL